MEANNEEVAMAQRDKAPVKLWLPAVAFFLAAVVVAEEKTDTDQRIITFHNDPYVTADREKKEVRIKAALSPDLRAVRAILEFLLISGVYRQETKEWEYDRGYESGLSPMPSLPRSKLRSSSSVFAQARYLNLPPKV